MSTNWLTELRSIFVEAQTYDWTLHLDRLNNKLGLADGDKLENSFPDAGPIWFNGDVEALEPGNWVLVISLNHQRDTSGEHPKREKFWEYCRKHNTEHWYARFFRPLVLVATSALGEEYPTDEKEFATRRMVFVELCPYASARFDPSYIAQLLETDRGFEIQWRVNNLLIEQAKPALILINGSPAVTEFQRSRESELQDWQPVQYPSASGASRVKNLWHIQGYLNVGGEKHRVAGFPFLRTMSSHNSNVELRQLGEGIRKGFETT